MTDLNVNRSLCSRTASPSHPRPQFHWEESNEKWAHWPAHWLHSFYCRGHLSGIHCNWWMASLQRISRWFTAYEIFVWVRKVTSLFRFHLLTYCVIHILSIEGTMPKESSYSSHYCLRSLCYSSQIYRPSRLLRLSLQSFLYNLLQYLLHKGPGINSRTQKLVSKSK